MSRYDDFFTGSRTFNYEPAGYEEAKEYLTGTGENDKGKQSGAFVTVKNPITKYSTIPDGDIYSENMSRQLRDSGKISGQGTQEKNGQHTLFNVKHTPPVLNHLFSTEDATPSAVRLASHALEETRRRFGERPLASEDTSAHATAFVNKAIKDKIIKGVEGKPEGELATQGNDINFDSAQRWVEAAASQFNDNISRTEQINQDHLSTDIKNLLEEAAYNRSKAAKGEDFNHDAYMKNRLKQAYVRDTPRSKATRQFTQPSLFENPPLFEKHPKG